RRAAADAVEQRDHLRHRRHRHLARRDRSEAAADQDSEREPPPARPAGLHPGDDDRDEHPDRAELVAAARVRGAREEAQREQERHDRDQVEEVREVVAHSSVFFGRSRLLNISSIRSVTTKPPTTFADASTTAMKPTIQANGPLWPLPS